MRVTEIDNGIRMKTDTHLTETHTGRHSHRAAKTFQRRAPRNQHRHAPSGLPSKIAEIEPQSLYYPYLPKIFYKITHKQ